METLTFEFSGGKPMTTNHALVIAGVLGSGNLEVLVIADPTIAGLRIEVATAARGFAPIWQAVMDDLFARWPVSGVQIAIQDAGATPAIVALRLDQAMDDFCGRPL